MPNDWRHECETLLDQIKWLDEYRPFIVWASYDNGMSKMEIHRRSGISRTTIDTYIKKWIIK